MSRASSADFFVARAYTHEREDKDGNSVLTVDRPDDDVIGRTFEFWPDKETRDAGKDKPLATFVASFGDFPVGTIKMLAAIGLNVRLNQQIDADSTVPENIEAMTGYYALLQQGCLREAGIAGGEYVPMFVSDFRRFLELQYPDTTFSVADAQRAINKAEEQMSEEDFNSWKLAVRKEANYQKAKIERLEKKASRAKDTSSDFNNQLTGLLDFEEDEVEAEVEASEGETEG